MKKENKIMKQEEFEVKAPASAPPWVKHADLNIRRKARNWVRKPKK